MAGTIVGGAVIHRSRGVVRLQATAVTDASGVVTAGTFGVAFGKVVGLVYDGGFDAAGTVTISDGKTGAAIITYTTGTQLTPVRFRPTAVITDNAGAAVSAAAGATDVNRDIKVAGKLNIAVAAGGNAKTGILAIIVDENDLNEVAV